MEYETTNIDERVKLYNKFANADIKILLVQQKQYLIK